MDDSGMDNLLRRVRPVGPAPALRQRVLNVAVAPSAWPWVGAAAAALVAAAGLPLATSNALGGTGMGALSDPHPAIVEATAATLGGDATARRLAEFMLTEHELHVETTPSLGETP